MTRRSTYSRGRDPQTGEPVHSLNLTTLQVVLGFVVAFASASSVAWGTLWVFADPRVVEIVKRVNSETVAPLIELVGKRVGRVEEDAERRDAELTKRLDEIRDDVKFLIRERANGGR